LWTPGILADLDIGRFPGNSLTQGGDRGIDFVGDHDGLLQGLRLRCACQ